ncbi:energy-coupling factor transporter ATP-binding protein EcfA2 [Rubrobacter xylanophilus]|uniref:Energy-coupling factor transporter ATP-binding protein EcfA2 n=1 Tax=Rubrobacter xylanophilus TaxID=49319 RepID=A0A510HIM5_9ACTN|nr:ATP-binding cassette domain-containing protein [Rubrobacter xylanophilus]BBL79840.1 energy-coupling factor transporter ATP-binding protein EcfA2 [Rubrobacter xylanophilus]
MSGAPLIELRDLRYTYLAGTPKAVEALRGVSLRIEEGERVAIVGPTRSGKSTLLAALVRLLRLGRGQVFYRGEDIAAPGYDRAALRREIGVVFQQPESQIVEDVVGADVAFGPTAAGLPAGETRRRVQESLDAVGLPYEQFRLRYVHALSGGQRRRVALAGVLAMRTPVLALDEPAAGLDPRGRRELLGLLKRLLAERRPTLIVCSASLDGAALLCDRAVVLDAGRVVMDGPLRDVLGEADRLAALDVTLSEAAALARELRSVIPELPAGILGGEELEAEILRSLGAA